MGLNPSNRLDEGLKGFPILGDPPFTDAHKTLALKELQAVGFPRGSVTLTMREHEVYISDSEAAKLRSMGIIIPSVSKTSETEWVMLYDVKAKLYGWKFYRAWYYWVAHTADKDCYIPKKIAREFNQKFRNEVRVKGYAGGQRVEGYAGGQDVHSSVSSYHIDTPSGLAALVKLFKERWEELENSWKR